MDAAINPEVIFGVQVSNVLTGSYAGSNFPGWMNCIGDDCYGGSRLGFMCIDKRLFDQIEATDIRRQNFLEQPVHNYYFGEKSTVTDNIPAYANLKFAAKVSPDGSTSAQYKQDIVVMRYSEAVLLKAEAQARRGEDGAAQATLSKLTTARGASAPVRVVRSVWATAISTTAIATAPFARCSLSRQIFSPCCIGLENSQQSSELLANNSEDLLTCEKAIANRNKSYKSSDRSEVVKPTAQLMKLEVRGSEIIRSRFFYISPTPSLPIQQGGS